MQKDNAVYKKRIPILYSLFLICCICILGGCSSLPFNLTSSVNSANNKASSSKATNITTPTPDPIQVKVQSLLSKMSLNDKLAQMIIVEYVGSDYAASGLQEMVAQQHVGGVLYQPDGNNNWDSSTTIDSVKAFSTQINADSTIAPLIAIDQEGGLVSKTSALFGNTPSAEQLVQTGDLNQAYNQAKTDVFQLKQLGINVDLAPVVDVGPDTTQYGSRFFSNDPTTVAMYAGAFLKGLQENGIAGTLKHFPGLGSSDDVDPHSGLPVVTKSLHDLRLSDFLPYQQIIQQDNPAMVMATDVKTQALDPNSPAELSPKVLSYLRNTLNFKGIIITDGLYMEGLYNGVYPSNDQLTQVSVQAIEAGNDMIEGPSTPAQISDIVAAVKTAIQQGKLTQSQIDQSVTRILKMKIQYRIIKLENEYKVSTNINQNN
jgi:beta-N-acetylhexosaminidase